MRGKKHYYDTFYNVQAAVSEQHIILHNDVCTSASDRNQLISAVEAVEQNTEASLEEVCFDAGYSSLANEAYLDERKIIGFIPDQDFGKSFSDKPYHRSHFRYDEQDDHFICPQGKRLTFHRVKKEKGYQSRVYKGEACQGCRVGHLCTKAQARTISREDRQELREQMRERLKSEYGKEIYKKRQYLIEPVFGHLIRNLGYSYFLLRGLDKVKAEFNIMCTAYNLMKIARKIAQKEAKSLKNPIFEAISDSINPLKWFIFGNKILIKQIV